MALGVPSKGKCFGRRSLERENKRLVEEIQSRFMTVMEVESRHERRVADVEAAVKAKYQNEMHMETERLRSLERATSLSVPSRMENLGVREGEARGSEDLKSFVAKQENG